MRSILRRVVQRGAGIAGIGFLMAGACFSPPRPAFGTNIPPVLTSAVVASNAFQFGVSGKAGKLFRVERSWDLRATNWQSVEALTAPQTQFVYSAGMTSPATACFYRVTMSPGTNPPAWPYSANNPDNPLSALVESPTQVLLTWKPASDLLDIVGYGIYQDGILFTNLAATSRSFIVSGLLTGRVWCFTVQAGNEDGNWTTNGPTVAVNTTPPDPAGVAPEPEPGVVTLVASATEFLFTGSNAIQTGVATGAIEMVRQAVLKGTVRDEAGQTLAGAVITVEDHPEYGQTAARSDGAYDLVVNGGQTLLVNVRHSRYIPVQRTVSVPLQNYVVVPDVTLRPADTNGAVVNLSAPAEMQISRGSVVSDSNGTRQVTVLFPTGMVASIVTDEGATQEVGTLTTRFTEFTVGTNGPNAMPGDLPPTVGYTYAVELGAGEAQQKVDGKDVLLSTQVYVYVENFLGMPAGMPVPVGYYDKEKGRWIPARDGLVIQLLGTNGSGLVRISVNTNGTEADEATLSSLGFTDEERRKLALTYAATQDLWRVPVSHFSWQDFNWGVMAASGAYAPVLAMSAPGQTYENYPTAQPGWGEIDAENQIFRESVPVAGTAFSLHYSSQRAPGYKVNNKAPIPLSNASVPGSLKRIDLRIGVAGRVFESRFGPAANLSYDFVWDGLDSYGRVVRGKQPVTIGIGYVYDGYYAIPRSISSSFGATSGERIPSNVRARQDVVLSQGYTLTLGQSFPQQGLGGWTLSCHHVYDPIGRVLHLGDGRSVAAEGMADGNSTVATIAGTGGAGFSGDGGPAVEASLNNPTDLAVGPDGSLYIADFGNNRVRKIFPNGLITTVAGNGSPGYSGDGGPATSAGMTPNSVAVGSDGSVYIGANARIRRVWPSGTITTVAGTGVYGLSGDDGPALNANISPGDLAVAPDGTVFFPQTYCVRRVGPDGVIVRFAGHEDTYSRFPGDGQAATNAYLFTFGIDAAPDGTVVIADGDTASIDLAHNSIRRVGLDGIIRKIAGAEEFAGVGIGGYSGDGGPALDAGIEPRTAAAGPDGSVFIGEVLNSRIRKIWPNGIITAVAGNGTAGHSGDNGPATAAAIRPGDIAVSPDGSFFFVQTGGHCIRQVGGYGRGFPGLGSANMLIASEDGKLLYEFNCKGRHLRTINALTAATMFEFAYTNGFLSRITDGDGSVTAIERDGAGLPTAIAAPDGQRTVWGTDGNGYLASIANPAGETVQLTHAADGLLTAVQGAKGPAYTYTISYDSDGAAVRLQDPAGGFTALGRVSISNGFETAATSAVGRVRRVRIERLSTGDRRRTRTEADGTRIENLELTTGAQTNWLPNGNLQRFEFGPDPRFGIQAKVQKNKVVVLPSGLASTTTLERTAGLAGSSPLSLTALTNRTTANGREQVSVFTASDRTITVTSPSGRQTRSRLDAMGRVVEKQVPGLATVFCHHDARGRLTNETTGAGAEARTVTYHYGADGGVAAMVDALGRTNRYDRDAVGRVITNVFPDGRTVRFTYDAQGNRTSVTPPGRPAHQFAYTPVDLTAEYVPPPVDGATGRVTFTYNLDRQPVLVIRPDGQTISNTYDSGGRLSVVALTNGLYTHAYATNGLLSTLTSPAGVTISNAYDGDLKTAVLWSGVLTGAVNYAYDSDFRVAALNVNGGAPVAFAYDADGVLTGAGACSFLHDPTNGLLIGMTMGSLTDTVTYSEYGEVTHHACSYGGDPLYSASYGVDKLGRITNKAEVVQGTTNASAYLYDAAGRLAEMYTNGSLAGAYLYDANGNCTSALVRGTHRVAAYDDQDRLVSVESVESGITNLYVFTAAGDLAMVSSAVSQVRYRYDARGNLLEVNLPGGTNIGYLADGLDRRVGKTVNGVWVEGFLCGEGPAPVAELDGASNVVSVFVYGKAHVPCYLVRSGLTYRIVCDHLGSPRLVVRADTGAVVQRMDFDEFGRVLNDTNPGFQPFGFAGGLYDPDTGLTRFGARDYDPEAGRWTTKDPALFSGGDVNLYVYVLNNPVQAADPAGTGPGFLVPAWALASQGRFWYPVGDSATLRLGIPYGSEAYRLQWYSRGLQSHLAVNQEYGMMRGLHYARGTTHWYLDRTVVSVGGQWVERPYPILGRVLPFVSRVAPYAMAAHTGWSIGEGINACRPGGPEGPTMGEQISESMGFNDFWSWWYTR